MFVERMYMNFRISYINNMTFSYLLHEMKLHRNDSVCSAEGNLQR